VAAPVPDAPVLAEVDAAVDALPLDPAPALELELPAAFANTVSVIGMNVLDHG
jgi:hypothetical protein